MHKIKAYKIHDADTLVKKIAELRKNGKHAYSMAALHNDANDYHGDPTYLIDRLAIQPDQHSQLNQLLISITSLM